MHFYRIIHLIFICVAVSLYSTPDLSMVGFIMPEDGLGKIPITILETMGEEVSANIISTDYRPPIKESLPTHTCRAINNPDHSPGKVSIFTETICSSLGNNYKNVPEASLIKIAYSMFEADRIPQMWVQVINDKFDSVVVPDAYLVKVYQDCGVTIPIFVLPIPMMLNNYLKYSTHQFTSYPFVFGDASANKNPAVLVKAFALAFGNSPHFHLILRAGHIAQETRDAIQPIIQEHELNNITIEDQHLILDQYIQRLSSFDCYVNLSRGEGFSFIPREALALGIPVIITNNTASATICDSGLVRAVASQKRIRSPSFVYKYLFGEDYGYQFDCEVEDAKNALLDVYHNYAIYLGKALEGRKWVSQYDCDNVELQIQYRTLVKPKNVVLGKENKIDKNTLTTNSEELYLKYIQITYNRNDITEINPIIKIK